MIRNHFPLLLIDSKAKKSPVQQSRKGPGRLLGVGKLQIAALHGDSRYVYEDQKADQVNATQTLYQKGLIFIANLCQKPIVKFIMADASLGECEVSIAWMAGHDVIAEVSRQKQEAVVRLDAGWVTQLDDLEQGNPGAIVLAGLVQLFVFQALAGKTQREAIHAVLDVVSQLSPGDREALLHLLKSDIVDPNHSLAITLAAAMDSDLAMEMEQLTLAPLLGVRTQLLYHAGNRLEHDSFKRRRAGGDEVLDLKSCLFSLIGQHNGTKIHPEEIEILQKRIYAITHSLNGHAPQAVVSLIEKTLKWRDKWVTWLLGRMRIDAPYDMERVLKLMREPMEDIDEKRALINEAIQSTYNYELEGQTIQRVSSDSRLSGMKLIAGRLSRAFGNQAQLLSVAKVLADKDGLLPHVKALHQASMPVAALQTHATRLLHLIEQHKPTPYAQTIGALNQYEEALFEYQTKEFHRMLREKDEASRRMIGRPDAEMCATVLDTIQNRISELYRLAAAFRDALEATEKRPAAYIILMQRLHPAESVNMANANFLFEVHPGKEEDLRDLMRQGGHYTYSSQGAGRLPDGDDTHWVIQVDDWIEAIPLFIHERVVNRTVKMGNEEVTVEVIETEVDQEAMEVFFRLHAEFWARNIESVMDSQHIGLARRLLVNSDDALKKALDEARRENPDLSEDKAACVVIQSHENLHEGVAALAALINQFYRDQVEVINQTVEDRNIERIGAVETVLQVHHDTGISEILNNQNAQAICTEALKIVHTSQNGLKHKADELRNVVTEPTRPTSSLHILTTESAGMTEGYVQSWIEEEMALFNVIRNEGLEDEVSQLMANYRTRIQAVARKVIKEFGMGVVIEEVMAQQRLPEPVAVMTVLTSFKPVMDEAAKLAVLIEYFEKQENDDIQYDAAQDPKAVDEYLKDKQEKLMKIAVPKVAENNGKVFERRVQDLMREKKKLNRFEAQCKVIAAEEDYAEELGAFLRFEARSKVLEKLNEKHPELKLYEQVRTYIRNHTALAKSTARKTVISKHKLHAATMHPLNYYQASGGNKRYHLLYTPSRVNLGERERDSVVKWRQWVGGADRFAAQAGFEFYSLINEGGVEERPALAYAEIQKTSENALCVTHFAGSNALALLCMAVLEGDVEDMADQMNLRHDRMVPPAGEGYGGYCVPKDGLFLAFVLSLQNDKKLQQMGIPEHLHDGVMQLAKEALLHQNNFESHFAWQRWAAEKLLEYKPLKKYFDIKDNLLVFHITKIASAIENLGQPWHETSEGAKLVANLAAQWGVDKMIIRAEQVNRFMVFYKAWMIYDAIREARSQCANCPDEANAVVALSAEYKPVQDIRFSTGMRLFEILAHTDEHLTHALDEEGQNLAYLMNYGFDPDTEHPVGKRAIRHIMQTFYLDDSNQDTFERLKEAFPPHQAPGDIIMSSVTMSSTQDLLHYTSDTRLEEIANQLQVVLGDYGLTEDQIRANCQVHGGRLREWSGIKNLPRDEQDELINRVGGQIHALVLQMRGPGRSYEHDLQGIDVLNTGIPFPELLKLLDNMPQVVALMRTGNPNSSLAITDGAAGRMRRALTIMDIKLFFATCESINRLGVYRAVGLGKHNIDRLRDEMHRQQQRAQTLFDHVASVAKASTQADKENAAQTAIAYYEQLRDTMTVEDEAGKALREEDKMKRYKKWKKRDYYISQSLAKISAGLPLQSMDVGVWIAGIGGVYVLINQEQSIIEQQLKYWKRGISDIEQLIPSRVDTEVQPFTQTELCDLERQLVRPKYVPESQRFAQQMLVESSSKAVEIAAREALERRKALKIRAERARAINDREDGFQEIYKPDELPTFDEIWSAAEECLTNLQTDLDVLYHLKDNDPTRMELQSKINHEFGRAIGYTRQILECATINLLAGEDPATQALQTKIMEDIAQVYTGRELILENLKKLMGGYEDIGAIARLAEACQNDAQNLERMTKVIELFYVTFALGQTLEFALQLPDEIDPSLYWKNLVDFFAESINDHWYEYWPWAYSRGVGFKQISDEQKFEWAVERHQWLYHYLRNLLIERTELREWAEEERNALLGDYRQGNSLVAIGANAASEIEKAWRAYNQLREVTFIKSDGFPLPEVFTAFDPDLIEADKRVNLAILFPVGRTHVSRAIREAPTLNQELQAEGHSGANIIITRYNELLPVEGAQKKALLLTDGHFYIGEDEYAAALKQCKGFKKSKIKDILKSAKDRGALTDKGIRIAARFMKDGKPSPIVAGGLVPFHGLPIYTSGQSEDEGIPATIQSQIYTDITYDKSLYPDIFIEGTGVELPPEIDWLHLWNTGYNADDIRQKIIDGFDEKQFSGLRKFAYDHPIILIKGAAESGARNLKVFEVQDERAQIKEDTLTTAAQFVYEVSKGQNVVIQAAVFTNPELWASPELMESFVDRQIMDWNTPVNRGAYPRSQIYGTMRIVVSSSSPDQPYDTAFPISLMSLQVATNVGRGGTLEPLHQEHIQPQFQEQIYNGLHAEGPKVMEALNAYIQKTGSDWEQQTGKKIGQDLRGVSYGWANYLMCDYVIMPVFEKRGRLVDIEPIYDQDGRRIGSTPILQDESGRFEGVITDWKFIHLEPNVGIGLWDRYNLREEAYEQAQSQKESREFNFHNVGQSDRIVLRNFILSGEDYLKVNFPHGICRKNLIL